MRTVTFTMEDALISPEGFMILSGAGLIDATADKPIYQHTIETVDVADISITNREQNTITCTIPMTQKPYLPTDKNGNYCFVMFKKGDEIISEPYIPVHEDLTEGDDGKYLLTIKSHDIYDTTEVEEEPNLYTTTDAEGNPSLPADGAFDSVLIDYYVERQADAQQIEITADKFGGNYYLEASTLFRDQNGVDMPAEFIIPNCKIQSNFTFTMASSGDPSTFTFTMDAFPDYTRFDHTKKVLAAIQIIKTAGAKELYRTKTVHDPEHEDFFI